MTNNSLNYELTSTESNIAKTLNGWKVIFPAIEIADDDDKEDIKFKKLYSEAIMDSEGELMRHADRMSTDSSYKLGHWHKCVNASFCRATKKLHDFVMGHNACDDLMFTLEVIDNRTIKIS